MRLPFSDSIANRQQPVHMLFCTAGEGTSFSFTLAKKEKELLAMPADALGNLLMKISHIDCDPSTGLYVVAAGDALY